MESYLLKTVYKDYLSASRQLANAQEKAKQYYTLFPLKSGQEAPELTREARRAFQRLSKAYVIYAKKYIAWKEFLKAYGL